MVKQEKEEKVKPFKTQCYPLRLFSTGVTVCSRDAGGGVAISGGSVGVSRCEG